MGFAAELNEKGLWKNGIEFGKKDNISQVLDDIAYRRGVGADLAEGVRAMSEKYGGKDYAPHVKGLEIAAYEPRGSVGHGLGYATASRGACHLDGGYLVYFEVTGPVLLDPYHWRSKPSWAVLDQNMMSAISSAGQCLFTSWTFVPPIAYKVPNSKIASKIVTLILTYGWASIEGLLMLPYSLQKIHVPLLPHTKAIKLATGMKFNFGKFIEVGARGYTLERLFNQREGIGKKDDTLPKRFTDEEQIKGRPETKVPIDKMLPRYYQLRGWDENGVPTAKTLKKLGLDFVNN
jgi:aldehyde:ferredoxin oxidoreductase